MLDNDPPSGTTVRFIMQVNKAKAGDRATLIRSLKKYVVETPYDEFEVEFLGNRLIVQRRDIEKT